MAEQINPSVTNPTIADIYQNIRGNKLILRPDFQRKFVWTQEHQDAFIDTIIRGLPFPEIYVCRGEVDIVNLTATQYVIDGQQRLTTIQNYIEDAHDQPFRRVPPFRALDPDQKQNFLSYKIDVRDIGDVPEDVIREIFRRINLTKFKVENVEIHNAVYDGAFIQTAKEILDNVDLRDYGVFHDSEFTRMADLHFILLVMATIENGGYFPQDNEVERFIAKNNNEYHNKDQIKKKLLKTFSTIDTLQLPIDSIWFRKSNFFTMVVEFSGHPELPQNTKDKLVELHERILQAKLEPHSEYGRYYSYMYTGTNGRKARVERAAVFKRFVFED